MVKYSLFALFVLISLAYVMAAPAANDEAIEAENPEAGEVDDVQPSGTKKTKRGIYGGGYGYGFGHYPYSYSYYPYYGGHYGGYGHSYYPYYYHHGFGHGYGHGGYLW